MSFDTSEFQFFWGQFQSVQSTNISMDKLSVRRLWRSWLGAMPLKVAAGRLDLLASSIVCQLQDGHRTIVCTIARQVLRDLGDYHFGKAVPDEAVLSECLSEIERLASTKFSCRGVDENGELTISPTDLVRYGFGRAFKFAVAAE